ncbi:hypothetical protein ACQW02_02975 [Humitalea sp. 24SJ18S-53]|uniref:hypothetical protein n=1 Tax=Humitalea sp. 24SJ18S-53 TaxID=3422307 RepID=UPI003D67307E
MPPPAPLAFRLAAILGAAALLLWPAVLNGYPILFIDASSYLMHTITGEAPWDKTAAYGPFLALFHQGVTLWFSVIGQALILSIMLWLVQRVALGQASPRGHLALAAGLAALTSAPWFVATIMPDYFTPLVVLSLFLLGFGDDRLTRAEMCFAGAIGALGIAVHLSHLPTACALVVLVLLLRRRLWPALRAALPIAAAILFLLGANWHAFGRATLSAHGSVFLLARLQADGPAVWTIRDRCPESGWHLCGFIDRMPMDSDLFLWNPESPPNRDAAGNHRLTGSELLAPEAREIVAATLRAYPLQVLWISIGNWWEQQFKIRIGDTFDNIDLVDFADRFLSRGFPPRESAAFAAGAQMRGELPRLAAPFIVIHDIVLVLAVPLALFGWWRLARRGDHPRLGLLLCVLVGLTANAFVAGALSKPHHRYEARIIWLLPMGAALAFWPRRPVTAPG